ncbi:hypothetical protein ACV242_004237 [Peribacillus simplex]
MPRKNNATLGVKDSSSSKFSKWYGCPRVKIALRSRLFRHSQKSKCLMWELQVQSIIRRETAFL